MKALSFENLKSSYSISDSRLDLKNINKSEVNISIWKRKEVQIKDSIQSIINSNFQSLQFIYDRNLEYEVVSNYFRSNLGLKTKDSESFYNDICLLTLIFLEFCPKQNIIIRLEKITHDNCKSFHVDHLYLRLLCTYHGLGTEWLTNENVRRSGLGQNIIENVVINTHQVQKFKTNWVGLLKGENYLDNANNGLVHRSPEICKIINSERLILRIDSIEGFGHKI